MEDIGSLIFYVILGIIALVGSVQGKSKKKPGAPKTVLRGPVTTARKPEISRPAPAAGTESSPVKPAPPVSKSSPWFMPEEPSMEGRYGEPMATAYNREGSTGEPMAGDFSSEGTYRNTLAEAFASEGSIADSMAAAFSSEGISSLGDSSIDGFIHTDISDSEIGDAPDFDYEATPGADIHTAGFNLKKAVIYSAILDRKEYGR